MTNTILALDVAASKLVSRCSRGGTAWGRRARTGSRLRPRWRHELRRCGKRLRAVHGPVLAATVGPARRPCGYSRRRACPRRGLRHGRADRPVRRTTRRGLGGGGRSIAVDVAATRERHPGVEVREASAAALPYPDKSFDVALAQLVVHFMPDPVAGLREMRRVTRRGGVVAACVWDHGRRPGPAPAVLGCGPRGRPGRRRSVAAPGDARGAPRRAVRRGRPGGRPGQCAGNPRRACDVRRVVGAVHPGCRSRWRLSRARGAGPSTCDPRSSTSGGAARADRDHGGRMGRAGTGLKPDGPPRGTKRRPSV